MSEIIKNRIESILCKNPHAQGVYQFEVIRSLVTSDNGVLPLDELVNNLTKYSDQPINELRSHCVFKKVLAKKGVIAPIFGVKKGQVVGWKLKDFDELSKLEKNELRNIANEKRRKWEASQ